MYTDDELAKLLVVAKTIHDRKDLYSLDKDFQDDACRRLNTYGVLSIGAISSVVGCSEYRTRKAIIGMRKPTARGPLNPAHITMLVYGLSNKSLPSRWVRLMVDGGTAVSTISSLTGIPESTIRRRYDE